MVMTGRREQWQQVAQARLAAGQLCQLLLEQLGFGIEVAALGPRRDRPGRPLGSRQLVQAWVADSRAEIDAAHAAGVPLVLAGKCDEPAERAYFEEYVRPRLTDKDHVFGQADAVSKRKLLAGARCLLFPVQWEEPFGMVMIEAMACGTPVVALRGGAVPEVVVDCVTGFVCDHPDELADAVTKTHTLDPAACRRHVAAHFAVGQFGSGYERIYRDVLSNADAAKSTITLRRVVEPDTSERATA